MDNPRLAGHCGGAAVKAAITVISPMPAFRLGLQSAFEEVGLCLAAPVQDRHFARPCLKPDHEQHGLLVTVHGPKELAVLRGASACSMVTIVGLINVDQSDLGASAIAAGAQAIATLQDDPGDIARCVVAALGGRSTMPRAIVTRLASRAHAALHVDHVEEVRWLKALASGTTIAALAESVGYSERVLYRRLATLYGYLGAKRRSDALSIAIRQGLI